MLTKKSFIKIMKNFALEKTAAKQNWFVIDFCQLGFIGTQKLYVGMVFSLISSFVCFCPGRYQVKKWFNSACSLITDLVRVGLMIFVHITRLCSSAKF